jgi:chromosome segregation ATPase
MPKCKIFVKIKFNWSSESEQEKILVRIADTNSEVNSRTVEIHEQRQELGAAESRVAGERREIERLELELKEATAVSHKCYQDIARLREAIAAKEMDNQAYGQRIAAMEMEVEQNQRRIAHLNESREQRDSELASTHQRISREQGAGSQLRGQNAQLDKDIQYFEGQNYKHQQAQIHLSKANEQEYFKGKDLQGLEADRRGLLKAREDELGALKYEIDHVKQSNAKYVDDSQELQTSIEALNRHVALLNQQNYEVYSL